MQLDQVRAKAEGCTLRPISSRDSCRRNQIPSTSWLSLKSNFQTPAGGNFGCCQYSQTDPKNINEVGALYGVETLLRAAHMPCRASIKPWNKWKAI